MLFTFYAKDIHSIKFCDTTTVVNMILDWITVNFYTNDNLI